MNKFARHLFLDRHEEFKYPNQCDGKNTSFIIPKSDEYHAFNSTFIVL